MFCVLNKCQQLLPNVTENGTLINRSGHTIYVSSFGFVCPLKLVWDCNIIVLFKALRLVFKMYLKQSFGMEGWRSIQMRKISLISKRTYFWNWNCVVVRICICQCIHYCRFIVWSWLLEVTDGWWRIQTVIWKK